MGINEEHDINYEPSSQPLLINIIPLTDNTDLEELEKDTHNLYDELNELDMIEKVSLVSKGRIPGGTKAGGDINIWGSLAITLATTALTGSSPLLSNITNTLQSWIKRNDNKKISLKIGGDELEVTGLSDMEQQRLIDVWISKCMEKK
jgi:hypothetical protein